MQPWLYINIIIYRIYWFALNQDLSFKKCVLIGNDVTLQEKNENFSFYSVLQANFGSHLLLYEAEQDGWSESPAQFPEHFVELKINSNIALQLIRTKFRGLSARENWKVNSKMRDYWTHCYSAGAGKLVLGFKDEDDVIRKVEAFDISELEDNSVSTWHQS